METHVSTKPQLEAAEYLNSMLAEDHAQYLVLLSGGSSLSVPEHIKPELLSSRVTFMMADDRFSNDPNINNYLQLRNTAFYNMAQEHHAAVMESTPGESGASPTEVAHSINKSLQYYFKVNPNAYVAALLGIGEDGHFASIFPTPDQESFDKRYRSTELYTAVRAPENQYPERMTITPYFLKNHIDAVAIYATGEKKCADVLPKLVEGHDIPEYQLPAVLLTKHSNSHLFTDCTTLG